MIEFEGWLKDWFQWLIESRIQCIDVTRFRYECILYRDTHTHAPADVADVAGVNGNWASKIFSNRNRFEQKIQYNCMKWKWMCCSHFKMSQMHFIRCANGIIALHKLDANSIDQVKMPKSEMERESDKKADNCFRSLKAYVNGPLEIATETQDNFISSRRVHCEWSAHLVCQFECRSWNSSQCRSLSVRSSCGNLLTIN